MNLHDLVKVADSVAPGHATITLSFDAWKEAAVAPTTHVVTVLPRKPGPRAEPVAANVVASLMHPDRKAINWMVRFSPRGDRLFTMGGAPSRLVQLWDVAAQKEIRRIELPSNYRGALLTPDWKTLYVPVQNRQVKTVEHDGKMVLQVQFSGAIRVWNLASGREQEPLPIDTGWAPAYGEIDPSGRYLVCPEQASFFAEPGARRGMRVEAWDLATGKRSSLGEEYAFQRIFPDGQEILVRDPATSLLKLLQFPTGKVLASAKCPVSEIVVAPDGAVVAASPWGSATLEVSFLDGKTLQPRGKLIGKGRANGRAWLGGRFTPDGKRFVIVDKAGNVLLWDVAGQKLARTLCTLANAQTPDGRTPWCRQSLAFSSDGKVVAVAWTSKWEGGLDRDAPPDPQNVPQPRVSLIPLDGSAPPRVLIAPHGYVGGLAFSPNGRMLAFGGAGRVYLFDLTKSEARDATR